MSDLPQSPHPPYNPYSNVYMNTNGRNADSRSFSLLRLYMSYNLEASGTSGVIQDYVVEHLDILHLQSLNSEAAVSVQDLNIGVQRVMPSPENLVAMADPENEDGSGTPQYFVDPSFINKMCHLYIIYGDTKSTSLIKKFTNGEVSWFRNADNFTRAVNGEILMCIPVDWESTSGVSRQYEIPDMVILPGKTVYALINYAYPQSSKYSSMFYQLTGSVVCQINMSYVTKGINAQTIPGYPFTISDYSTWTVIPN